MPCWSPPSARRSCMGLLMLFPQAMFPNSAITGLEWLLPITIIALAWSDIMLAALAYRHDVTSTVRARAIVEPMTISAAALAWAYISTRDGLIIAYVLSMVGRADRVDDPVLEELRHAARLGPRSGNSVADGPAQHSGRRRGRGRVGFPPDRHRGPRPVLLTDRGRHLLCRAERRVAAGQAQDQLRPDPRAGDRQQFEGRRQGSRRQASPAGRLLGDRRPARCRACLGHPRRSGDGPGRTGVRRPAPRPSPSCSPRRSLRPWPRSARPR